MFIFRRCTPLSSAFALLTAYQLTAYQLTAYQLTAYLLTAYQLTAYLLTAYQRCYIIVCKLLYIILYSFWYFVLSFQRFLIKFISFVEHLSALH